MRGTKICVCLQRVGDVTLVPHTGCSKVKITQHHCVFLGVVIVMRGKFPRGTLSNQRYALLLLAVWCFCLCGIQASQAPCPNFNVYSTNSANPYMYYYYSGTSKQNWTSARTQCAAIHPNSDLMIVRDLGSLALLTKWKVSWMGFYQAVPKIEPDGNWFWIDGTPVLGYVNPWAPNRPDNYGYLEDCGATTNLAGYIDDEPCGDLSYYICEVNCKD
jgi:hypothetical protein